VRSERACLRQEKTTTPRRKAATTSLGARSGGTATTRKAKACCRSHPRRKTTCLPLTLAERLQPCEPTRRCPRSNRICGTRALDEEGHTDEIVHKSKRWAVVGFEVSETRRKGGWTVSCAWCLPSCGSLFKPFTAIMLLILFVFQLLVDELSRRQSSRSPSYSYIRFFVRSVGRSAWGGGNTVVVWWWWPCVVLPRLLKAA